MNQENKDLHDAKTEQDKFDKEQEVSTLMKEIDEKVERFVRLTGARGKPVKRRWRDIKKRAGK